MVWIGWQGSSSALGRRYRPRAPTALVLLVATGLTALLTCLSGRALSAESMPARTPLRTLARFDIPPGGGPIVIPVALQVNDADSGHREVTLWMLLDTGTTRTTFDSRHRNLLGPSTGTTTTRTLAGEIVVENFKPPRLRYGAVIAEPVDEVKCLDLRSGSHALGVALDGILGMDILCLHLIAIDFDAGKLEIYVPVKAQFGIPIPIEWDHVAAFRIPHVRANLGDGKRELLKVDTGFVTTFAGGLSVECYDRLVEAGMLTPLGPHAHAAFAGPDRNVQGALARASRFSLGPNTHKRLLFAKMRSNRIGLDYLSRYCVTFDFANSVMYLRPGKGFQRVDTWQMCGLDLVRGGEGISVGFVADKTPAVAAGFREGDLIIAVDGDAAENMSIFTFNRKVASQQRHVIRVRRANAERSLVLDLGVNPAE